MSKHERSFDVGKDERLRVLWNGRARRRVTHMPDAQISVKRSDILRVEHFIDATQALIVEDLIVFNRRVSDCDTCALLPAVLQSIKPVVNRLSHVAAVEVINAEHPARFAR